MIQKSVDFALRNRFLVLAVGLLLLIWGAISFKSLPVEAYPDVAHNGRDAPPRKWSSRSRFRLRRR